MRSSLLVLAVIGCAYPHGGAEPDAAVTPDAAGNADGSPTSGDDPATWHAHADDALQTLLLRYWTPGYLAAASPTNGSVTGYWTFAQALDAVEDGVVRTGGARFAGWIEALYLAQNARGWARDFYDDENWMTLALIRAYDLSHDAKYLDEAKALYADIEAAWDTTCCGPHPGGIWWDRPHTQKATAANAGPVIAGVRLAARTNNAAYLTFAKQVYAYWLANMVDPTTFAVSDDIRPDGTIKKYRFTYNEGLVIGAAVALYGATQDPTYLADAHHVAGYMLAAETKTGVLYDGTNTGCANDCQQFKGIGYRYLQELQAISPTPEVGALLATSAHAIWDHARAATGLYATDWTGPTVTGASIDADSSAAMALNLYAASLGPYPPADAKYQAEDGVNHGIGLEASHAGFGGLGLPRGVERRRAVGRFPRHRPGRRHVSRDAALRRRRWRRCAPDLCQRRHRGRQADVSVDGLVGYVGDADRRRDAAGGREHDLGDLQRQPAERELPQPRLARRRAVGSLAPLAAPPLALAHSTRWMMWIPKSVRTTPTSLTLSRSDRSLNGGTSPAVGVTS